MNTINQTLGADIETKKDELANLIVNEQWARNPSFKSRYGEVGHAKCVQDVKYNLSYLSQALTSDSPPLFTSYLGWVKVLFAGLKIPTGELAESLEITGNLLGERFPESAALIKTFIEAGLKHLADSPEVLPSFFDGTHPLSTTGQRYLDYLRSGERAKASGLILDAVAQGSSVKDIYLQIFQPSQHEIGRLWQMNQMSVAEEHYCTAATQLIMSQLYPNIFNSVKNGRRLVAACVGNELHEIGLRMVADFFEMDGWDTYYLGSSTPASSIVRTLIERKADVLAVSATMTFHIQLVADLIQKVRAADPHGKIKILAGGYPFNIEPQLWRQVGADGSALNAQHALQLAEKFNRMKAKEVRGLALLCDEQGLIQQVLRNDLNLPEVLVGRLFFSILEEASRAKAMDFLLGLKAQGSLLDWEMNVQSARAVISLHFAAGRAGESLLITASTTSELAARFFADMMRINNEQTNTLRSIMKENAVRAREEMDHSRYEEISRLNNELVSAQRELAKKNAELERLGAEVQRLSWVDELTQVYNRRGLFEFGRREVERAKRFDKPLSALMLDIDHFKQVNDTHGHATGDKVLKEVAARCNRQLRAMDIFGRYGGEEFAVLMPETMLTKARIVAERLLQQISAEPINTEHGLVTVTVSVGIADLTGNITGLEGLLESTDRALYQAKRLGRNRVCVEGE